MPRNSSSGRARRSPETHLDEVRALIAELAGGHPVVGVAPAEAIGRRLAADVAAVEDSPRFDNSQMDGYALAASHLAGGTFAVGPVVAAGTDPRDVLTDTDGAIANAVIPVMTGSRLPVGTAAVVPVEHCEPPDFGTHRVTVPPAPSGQFVRPRGADIRTGETLLSAGERINPRTVGVAAAQGITELPVRRAARVLICTGGDEIGGADARPGTASIRDANGPMLQALCTVHRIDVAGTVRTSDDPDTFQAALAGATAASHPDAVITSGGISHGAFEVVRQVLSDDAGTDSWFGHVAQQPGGPQGLARFHGVPVICLPGNPVSTAVSFRLFVAPVLGEVAATTTAQSTTAVAGLAGRDCFLRARTSVHDARLQVTPVGGAGSHLLAQSVPADALMRIPADTDVSTGATVEVHLLD